VKSNNQRRVINMYISGPSAILDLTECLSVTSVSKIRQYAVELRYL